MKQFNLMIVVILTTVMLCLTSCSTDDDNSSKINPIITEPTIIGEWEFGDIVQPCGVKNSIEFLPNYGYVENQIEANCTVREYEDNYVLVGDQLTMTGSTKTILELTNEKLILLYSNNHVEIFYRKD